MRSCYRTRWTRDELDLRLASSAVAALLAEERGTLKPLISLFVDEVSRRDQAMLDELERLIQRKKARTPMTLGYVVRGLVQAFGAHFIVSTVLSVAVALVWRRAAFAKTRASVTARRLFALRLLPSAGGLLAGLLVALGYALWESRTDHEPAGSVRPGRGGRRREPGGARRRLAS